MVRLQSMDQTKGLLRRIPRSPIDQVDISYHSLSSYHRRPKETPSQAIIAEASGFPSRPKTARWDRTFGLRTGQSFRPVNAIKVPTANISRQPSVRRKKWMPTERPTESLSRDVVYPSPSLHLDECGFSESFTKGIVARNSGSSPTALQAHSWPVALSGRDVVVVDSTASKGKSLAYLVPAIVHVQHKQAVQHPPAAPRGGWAYRLSADGDSGGGSAGSRRLPAIFASLHESGRDLSSVRRSEGIAAGTPEARL
ncbi:hypothetical protein MTO96_040018 [Rhipicephalus appendiculatus]